MCGNPFKTNRSFARGYALRLRRRGVLTSIRYRPRVECFMSFFGRPQTWNARSQVGREAGNAPS